MNRKKPLATSLAIGIGVVLHLFAASASAQVATSITLRDTWSGNGWANIGSVDTGIWINHFKLRDAPRLHLSANFIQNCGPNTDVAETACLDPVTGAPLSPARGHGTMSSGVMVADNADDSFVGSCFGCSLLLARDNIQVDLGAPELVWLTRNGIQVANASWGSKAPLNGNGTGPTAPPFDCQNSLDDPTLRTKPVCDAIDLMTKRDVVLVAAVGNNSIGYVDFPAADARTIAVGGLVSSSLQPGANAPYGWVRWDERALPYEVAFDESSVYSRGCPYTYKMGENYLECGSNSPMLSGKAGTLFSAPARDVLTTFIPYFDYQAIRPSNMGSFCTDSAYSVVGEDTCRGTSFSAPRVTGAVARVRSLDPLLSVAEVKSVLMAASPLYDANQSSSSYRDQGIGYGIPNIDNTQKVGTPWQIVFGARVRTNGLWYNYVTGASRSVNNRLTPMFGLTRNSGTRQDWLYTAVPQVATAAVLGELHTRPNEALTTPYVSNTASASISQYTKFPMEVTATNAMKPRASFFVYTSNGGTNPPGDTYPETFAPLFRLSAERRCSSGLLPHIYATSVAERNQFVNSGLPSALVCPEEAPSTIKFNWDAVEGYLMSSCAPRFNGCADSAPATTPKCVYRRFDPARGTWALLIGSQRSNAQYAGFTSTYGAECLGYAAENIDADNDGVIDASEGIIGTNPTNPDSDNDGWNDGVEYSLTKVSKCDPTVNDSVCTPY